MSFKDGQIGELKEEARSAGTPVLDLERYRPLAADLGVPDEKADEFLRTMWFIMCSFVDAGWGLDSVQNIFPFLAEKTSPTSPAEVECEKQSRSRTFEAAAHDPAGKDGKR